MKSFVIRALGLAAAIAAVFAGCKTMYDMGAGGEGEMAAPPADELSDTTGAAGSFANGSHDFPGAVPPPLDVVDTEGQATFSHFRAIQIDPLFEDTAGPKFIVHGDIDQDGLEDLVTGWNQSQPVQVHLQRRDGDSIRFEAINIGGTHPLGILAGVELGDFNDDEWLDIAVAVKHNGEQAFCGDAPVTWCGMTGVEEPTARDADVGEVDILFNPGSATAVRDGETWNWVRLADDARGWSSRLDGRRDEKPERGQRAPEWNSYTALAVGDITCDGYPDIVVCFNPDICKEECEEFAVNRLVLYANPGPAQAAASGTWTEVWIYASSGPIIKDCAIDDVDGDGDLDIIFTNPDSASANISWARNPCLNDENGPGGSDRTLVGDLEVWFDGAPRAWEIRPIGHVDPQADVITVGDVDGDGQNDVLVRSTNGKIVQWFKRPTLDGTEPIFPESDPPVPDRESDPDTSPGPYNPRWNFPWPVFAVAEFEIREPEGIALGDVTADGQVEAIVAAGGAVFWYEFDPNAEGGVLDQWVQNFIVDDSKDEGQTVDPLDPDFEDRGTFINTVLILDIDGDGAGDILATLDRRTLSGVAEDTLIWFRNTLLDPTEQAPEP